MEEQTEPTLDNKMKRSLAMASHTRHPIYTDREMWIAIRAGVLEIVKAIEIYARDKPLAMAVRTALLRISAAIELRWNLRKRQN